MLIRTHLMITLFFILLFIASVEHKFVFAIVALAATFVPDIDSKHSVLGRKKLNRILQFFVKHRGIIHSFVFLILITLLFALFLPIVALPFFLGYGLHLLADSFTVEGIKPFYPFLRKKSSWKIRTGGKTEAVVFVVFLILDSALIFVKVFGVL